MHAQTLRAMVCCILCVFHPGKCASHIIEEGMQRWHSYSCLELRPLGAPDLATLQPEDSLKCRRANWHHERFADAHGLSRAPAALKFFVSPPEATPRAQAPAGL